MESFADSRPLGSVIFTGGEDVEAHEELLFLSDLHLNARDLGSVVTPGCACDGVQGSLVVDSRVVPVALPGGTVHQTGIVDSAAEKSVLSRLSPGDDSVATTLVHVVVGSGDNALGIQSVLVLDGARHVFVVLATVGLLGLLLIQLLHVSLVQVTVD